MEVSFWLRGFILGFAIAAPVGPIGLLVIQRTLNRGQLAGLLSGLGAATADAFYGAIAAFGLTLVTTFLVQQQLWLGLAGGLFLCYLGARTILAQPAAQAAQAEARSLLAAYTSTLALTLTNPLTILAFVAIFAGAGLAADAGATAGATAVMTAGATAGATAAAVLLVLGVFCGSAGWWLLLSTLVGLLRTRINGAVMLWVNRVAGAVIVGFGLLAIIRVLHVV